MKQYLLSVVTPTGATPPAPDELEAIMKGVSAFHDELKAAGAWVFAGGLHAPDTATVVRVTDGETVMTDGPFIEGKEYLGGICIVKAADLDEALEWGRRAATAIPLPIEVRPFVDG
ncbi:YciI family protein [Actinacidiphila rubida]|uniref:Uncharacterized conserved protein n=1 Tax=Actinacidiphila rubida TaxID=310780 RepID=A0A1H8RRN6_9ACTN|nr:YciI family protein [Actinacidiphila rubida]SEO68613.1 Uncharacterized conserved protein [Actinacidiphila rubida]